VRPRQVGDHGQTVYVVGDFTRRTHQHTR
jgi:hypothetical protein